MPSSETQTNEPKRPDETSKEIGSPPPDEEPRPLPPPRAGSGGSRWVDYDTHELLTLISELEDERRWARLREGIWIAILLHLALLSAVTWIPKYILKVPQVVDKNEALKQHKDFTYLDSPPEAFLKTPPKVVIKPVPVKRPLIDKETLEAMNRATAPPAPAPQPSAPAPAPPPPPPSNSQPTIEAPHPAAVPARPNFAMGSLNPADQLRDAMKNASRNPGSGGVGNLGSGGGLSVIQGPARAALRFCLIRRAWISAPGCSAGIGRRCAPGIR